MPPLLATLLALLHTLPRSRGLSPIDLQEGRKLLREELRGMERVGQSDQALRIRSEWLSEDRQDLFFMLLDVSLRERFELSGRKEVMALTERAMRSRIHGYRVTLGTALDTHDFDDLAEQAWNQAGALPYAQRMGLLRESTATWEIQPPGAMLLRLPPLDALRWLLALEAAQQELPGFVGPAFAKHLLEASGQREDVDSGEPPQYWTWWMREETLTKRLEALGLLRKSYDACHEQTVWITVTSAGESLLKEIADGAETPFSILAGAVSRDGSSQTLAAFGAPASAAPAAEELVRQARLVVHELGNALAPTRAALDALFALLAERGLSAPEVTRYRGQIDAGLDRVHRFSKDFLTTASLGGTVGRERLDVAACLRDAIAELNGAAAPVNVDAPARLPPVLGKRPPLVMALRELLRNALRATQGRSPALVRVSVQLDRRNIQVLVDDNGPGVDKAQREAIFSDGVSSRSEGGFGLGQVREVARAFSGRIECQDSPLGGARFAMTLPFLEEA